MTEAHDLPPKLRQALERGKAKTSDESIRQEMERDALESWSTAKKMDERHVVFEQDVEQYAIGLFEAVVPIRLGGF